MLKFKQDNNPACFKRLARKVFEKDRGKRVAIAQGGMGDFIALDGYLTPEQRSSFDVLYQIGHRPPMYESMLSRYYNVKEYKYFWDYFEKKATTFANRYPIISAFNDVFPNGLKIICTEIDWRRKSFLGSTFMDNTWADISKFKLPSNFLLMCPFTVNATGRGRERKFNQRIWNLVLSFLDQRSHIFAVVIGVDCICPHHPQIINLSDKTSMAESIEIAKAAEYYIGIDSMHSVIAGYHIPESKTLVKSRMSTGIAYQRKKLYYPRGIRLVDDITRKNIDWVI